jgi:hypothetical protein
LQSRDEEDVGGRQVGTGEKGVGPWEKGAGGGEKEVMGEYKGEGGSWILAISS